MTIDFKLDIDYGKLEELIEDQEAKLENLQDTISYTMGLEIEDHLADLNEYIVSMNKIVDTVVHIEGEIKMGIEQIKRQLIHFEDQAKDFESDFESLEKSVRS